MRYPSEALLCMGFYFFASPWGYRLARQYAERYNARYGTGLIPESAPLVEDIADFWCQYHLGKPLREWLGTPSLQWVSMRNASPDTAQVIVLPPLVYGAAFIIGLLLHLMLPLHVLPTTL